MLIFIENTPRAYAWGSRDALPDLLGRLPTGEPQAELWLGAHPGSPASVAKATPEKHTLIDLIESDPERYGVNGGPLPFLLKVLAIGAPLSLQVHPNIEQARAGYAAEEAAGVAKDARDRNYGDANHKPELLVALSAVTALCGFRSVCDARVDLLGLARRALAAGDGAGAAALTDTANRLLSSGARTGVALTDDAGAVRQDFLSWAFSGDATVTRAVHAIGALLVEGADPSLPGESEPDPGPHRLAALASLTATHPGDPGVLVSLLLHLVRLAPGEAIYLGARQLHAYLGGIGVEVMAASDNVLRAGLTEKHVDIAELCKIIDPEELAEPRCRSAVIAPGLIAWQPEVTEFQLQRARVSDPESTNPGRALPGSAEAVTVQAGCPVVLIVTQGHVRVERPDAEFAEVAMPRRGQSMYVSAGSPIRLSGEGEVFLATVGAETALA